MNKRCRMCGRSIVDDTPYMDDYLTGMTVCDKCIERYIKMCYGHSGVRLKPKKTLVDKILDKILTDRVMIIICWILALIIGLPLSRMLIKFMGVHNGN